MFRSLKASEVEARVSTVNEKGCSILLYKDARCDMNILDETVGAKNWQRSHTRDNANCIVSIWDSEKLQWISKEDTGTESYTEKEKGLASDSFKRACFNWGIGRELYTAPSIWITGYNQNKNGKNTVYEKFKVSHMKVDDGIITGLTISDSKGKEVFKYIKENVENNKKKAIDMIIKEVAGDLEKIDNILGKYRIKSLDLATETQLKNIYKELKEDKNG